MTEIELCALLEREALPASFLPSMQRYLLPLADRLSAGKGHGMLLLGISGAQGSGKSTWASLLASVCLEQFGWNVATLSLDDLYLGRAARQVLALQVHPLLATRGVPGTHDVELGLQIIAGLRSAGDGDVVFLPRFNKAQDEPLPRANWRRIQGPVDLLIFEGWCLGALPQGEDELEMPCNELEEREDAEGIWRRYANRQLAGAYPSLFEAIDYRIFLKVPDWASVLRWRSEQEEGLRRQQAGAEALMDAARLARFVQFFERITRAQWVSQPAMCDAVFELDQAHSVAVAVYRDQS